MSDPVEYVLDRLIVRKEHLLCTRCGAVEPVHPGNGTPATTFIAALERAALRHRDCCVSDRLGNLPERR